MCTKCKNDCMITRTGEMSVHSDTSYIIMPFDNMFYQSSKGECVCCSVNFHEDSENFVKIYQHFYSQTNEYLK